VKDLELTPAQFEEVFLQLERDGLLEKKRDARGNVVMQPDSNGKPAIVWMRTTKEFFKREGEQAAKDVAMIERIGQRTH
jgi:hypothetical protein